MNIGQLLFDKIIINNTEVNISELDSNDGKYRLPNGITKANVEFVLKDKTTIPAGVFNSNNQISKIIIPNTVETIAARAFEKDENLNEISLPEDISDIGDNAFDWADFDENTINAIKAINPEAYHPKPVDTETETNSETETNTETGTETQTQTETQSETETGTETQTQTETDTETQTQTETDTETQTQTETQSETETQEEPLPPTDIEPETETQEEPLPPTNIEPETETSSETETQSDIETETLPEEVKLYWYVGNDEPTANTNPENGLMAYSENHEYDYGWEPITSTPQTIRVYKQNENWDDVQWYMACPAEYGFTTTTNGHEVGGFSKSQVTIAGVLYDVFTGLSLQDSVNTTLAHV